MKNRRGFVTNSSSSSYVCRICGDVQSGWDLGMQDAGMVECENGHVFCEYHSNYDKDKVSIEEMYNFVVDWYKRIIASYEKNNISKDRIDRTKKEMEEFAQFDKEDDDDIDRINDWYQEIVYESGISERFCPICNLSDIEDSEFIKYVFIEYGINGEDVYKKIKNSFSNHKEFKAFLDENKI